LLCQRERLDIFVKVRITQTVALVVVIDDLPKRLLPTVVKIRPRHQSVAQARRLESDDVLIRKRPSADMSVETLDYRPHQTLAEAGELAQDEAACSPGETPAQWALTSKNPTETSKRRRRPERLVRRRTLSCPASALYKKIRDNKRRLLPSNIFVQILAGPPELRGGFFGIMLKTIALTTLVAFPVLMLLLLQIQFLPFHDTRITWPQRGALVVDVLLLWPLRPPILTDLSAESYGRAQLFSRALRTLGFAGAFAMGVTVVWFSMVVATSPGEWQETAFGVLGRSHQTQRTAERWGLQE
jgi:hypothetical protein